MMMNNTYCIRLAALRSQIFLARAVQTAKVVPKTRPDSGQQIQDQMVSPMQSIAKCNSSTTHSSTERQTITKEKISRSAYRTLRPEASHIDRAIKKLEELTTQGATETRLEVRSKKFVDTARVTFRGGKGGDGCISMLSLFANEFAGPDGGNGGNGGHVVLRASQHVKSLNNVQHLYHAKPGIRGMGKCQFGANAEHLFVDVPVGTLVSVAKPKELADHEFDPDKSDIIAELDVVGSMFIAARGGAGGRGNATYLSNKNRHPGIAEAGATGDVNIYELRLKVYAHVGLIGLPNAGKSSLLRALTGANVKIGDYTFTTIHPQVGVVKYEDFTQVAISDLPGLIEDAHKNRGLGVQFLRSLSRCACLLYLIDVSDPDPVKQFETLVQELEMHKKGMSVRPHLIVGNKIDHPNASKGMGLLKEYMRKTRPNSRLMFTSSEHGDGLEMLRMEIKRMHDEYQLGNSDDALKW